MSNSLTILTTWTLVFLSHQAVTGQGGPDTHKFDSAVLQFVEKIDVPATANGPLQDLAVATGDMVQSGQVLAQVDDADVKIQLHESEVEFEITKTQVESEVDIEFAIKSKAVAMADYRRAKDSNRKYAGVVSDREMDRLKLLVEQSTAELQQTRFEKKLLKMQLKLREAAVQKNRNLIERHQIRSGFSGQVVEIFKQKGEWVNVSDPVLKIVRTDKLRVEHYLPLTLANRELVGSAAQFQPAGSEKTYPGTVVFVAPEINPLNSTAKVWIEFDNKELQLRAGMKGSVIMQPPAKSTNATTPEKG